MIIGESRCEHLVLQALLSVLVLAAGVTRVRPRPAPAMPPAFRTVFTEEGTPPPGKPRSIPHTDERAGYPRSLAKHLEPSTTPGGIGYYVGGGVPFGHGQAERRDATRGPGAGTRPAARISAAASILGWSHGRKYQGGTGAYRTDGPVVARRHLRDHQRDQQPGTPRRGRGARIASKFEPTFSCSQGRMLMESVGFEADLARYAGNRVR